MPFLYKHKDRLVRDAKKIRKLFREEFKKEIKNQSALDLVAGCLGWESWNKMHTANHKMHSWWHDMRWREKIELLNHHMTSSIDKIDEDEKLFLSIEQREKIIDVLTSSLRPPINPMGNQKKGYVQSLVSAFNSNKHPIGSYLSFDDSRRREGVFFVPKKQSDVTEHLKHFFLPENDYPDCVISSGTTLESVDFVRCFSEQGYKIVLLDDKLKLPHTIKHKSLTLLPNFNDDKTDPFGIHRYLTTHVSQHQNLSEDRYYQKALDMIDLTMLTSTNPKSNEFDGTLLQTPSLSRVLDVFEKENNDTKKATIQILVKNIYSGQETIESIQQKITTKQDSVVLEQWQYVTMQISSIVDFIREKYASHIFSSAEATSYIVDLKRDEERCVYFFTPSLNQGFTENSHSQIIFDMLKLKLENDGPSIKGDLWFLSPYDFANYSKVVNKNNTFDFEQLNRSGINLFIYDENVNCSSEFDTVIYHEQNNGKLGYTILDSRKEVLARTVWKNKA